MRSSVTQLKRCFFSAEMVIEERAPTPSGYAVEATPQVRIACAMRAPEGGWHSNDLIACCVLQTLLGGGDSFSAGGQRE